MPTCPNCKQLLKRQMTAKGVVYACPTCNGRLVGLGVLRRSEISQKLVTDIWKKVKKSDSYGHRKCPHCRKVMTQVCKGIQNKIITLDICALCHCIWFDPTEFQAFPRQEIVEYVEEEELSEKAREALARFKISEMKNQKMELEEASRIGTIFDLIRLMIKNFIDPT